MNTKEIGDLLGLMALVDKRQTGVGDIMAWEEYLPAGMHFDDARAALRNIRIRTSEWVTPAHIINEVREIQRARLVRAGTPPIPGDLTQAQERQWVRIWCDQIKSGDTITDATYSANLLMDLPTELAPTITDESRVARKAQLESVLSASKRVPTPSHPATNRTEQQQ